ncbi:LysR family transcriptional regulator [Chromobacterium haemolyticum]|uniref:LysR family transcriptional regulator n=1 Tax=Chromobacterium haemolyticum TaxID=394935 RepID=UPI00307EBEEC
MDIRSLKAFIAVFEERNITQASARLYLSQPALSATIRQLEEQLGAVLFQRQPRGVEVTDAARLLYPSARRLVEEADSLTQLFRGRQDCQPLMLGVAADLGQADVARVLAAAYRAVDGLLLELAAGCAGDARLDEEANRCEDELFLPLWEEDYVLAMRSDLALAAQPLLRPGQLLGQDLIACPDHPSHQRFASLLGVAARELAVAARCATLQQAATLAAAGAGIAFVPQGLAKDHPKLSCVRLEQAELSRRVGLCYAPDALAKPALARLKQALAAD